MMGGRCIRPNRHQPYRPHKSLCTGRNSYGPPHPPGPPRSDGVVPARQAHRTHRRAHAGGGQAGREAARRATGPRPVERPARRGGAHQPPGPRERELRPGGLRRPGGAVGRADGVGLRRLRGHDPGRDPGDPPGLADLARRRPGRRVRGRRRGPCRRGRRLGPLGRARRAGLRPRPRPAHPGRPLARPGGLLRRPHPPGAHLPLGPGLGVRGPALERWNDTGHLDL